MTATPTAAVVLHCLLQSQCTIMPGEHSDASDVWRARVSLRVCEALGLDHSWYEVADSA